MDRYHIRAVRPWITFSHKIDGGRLATHPPLKQWLTVYYAIFAPEKDMMQTYEIRKRRCVVENNVDRERTDALSRRQQPIDIYRILHNDVKHNRMSLHRILT